MVNVTDVVPVESGSFKCTHFNISRRRRVAGDCLRLFRPVETSHRLCHGNAKASCGTVLTIIYRYHQVVRTPLRPVACAERFNKASRLCHRLAGPRCCIVEQFAVVKVTDLCLILVKKCLQTVGNVLCIEGAFISITKNLFSPVVSRDDDEAFVSIQIEDVIRRLIDSDCRALGTDWSLLANLRYKVLLLQESNSFLPRLLPPNGSSQYNARKGKHCY